MSDAAQLRRRWFMRQAVWVAVCVAVIAACVIVTTVTGQAGWRNVPRGALIGSLLLILVVGVWELVAPSLFLRWREWMMAGQPRSFATVAAVTDRALGAAAHGPAIRSVRFAGALLLVAGTASVVLVWWLLGLVGLT